MQGGSGSTGRHRVAILIGGGVPAASAEGSSWGQIHVFGCFDVTARPADADHDVSHEEREVAGRMRVPLGIGSRQIAGRRGGSRSALCFFNPKPRVLLYRRRHPVLDRRLNRGSRSALCFFNPKPRVFLYRRRHPVLDWRLNRGSRSALCIPCIGLDFDPLR